MFTVGGGALSGFCRFQLVTPNWNFWLH